MLPFSVLPSPLHTLLHLFYHWSKQCWKSSFVRAFGNSANFHLTSSIDSNQFPFKADLIFRKRKKSQGAKSGEYGVSLCPGVPLVAKQRFTHSTLWAGMLTWCKIHCLFFRNSGCFLQLVLTVLLKLLNSKFGLQFDPLTSNNTHLNIRLNYQNCDFGNELFRNLGILKAHV